MGTGNAGFFCRRRWYSARAPCTALPKTRSPDLWLGRRHSTYCNRNRSGQIRYAFTWLADTWSVSRNGWPVIGYSALSWSMYVEASLRLRYSGAQPKVLTLV
jgi:hypothetical protein